MWGFLNGRVDSFSYPFLDRHQKTLGVSEQDQWPPSAACVCYRILHSDACRCMFRSVGGLALFVSTYFAEASCFAFVSVEAFEFRIFFFLLMN